MITYVKGDSFKILKGKERFRYILTDFPYVDTGASRIQNEFESPCAMLSPTGYAVFLHKVSRLFRNIATEDAVIIIYLGYEAYCPTRVELESYNFVLEDVYIRKHGLPKVINSIHKPLQNYDYVVVFSKFGSLKRDLIDVSPLLRFSIAPGQVTSILKSGNGVFSCSKPVNLTKALIKTYFIDKDEPILDPFAGYGTTLIAADQLHRDAIGIEINRETYKTGLGYMIEKGIEVKTMRRGEL